MDYFKKITIETPESVELEFSLAGIGNRAYALIIDYLIWGAILIVFLILWALFYFYFFSFLVEDIEGLGLWLNAIGLLIYFSIYVGYFIFFEVFWQGQTPGKRVVKIRVIGDDGKTISLLQATLRAILRPIDDILLIGAFFIVLGRQEKRIGDLVGGTIVVQEESAIVPDNFTIAPTAEKLALHLSRDQDLSRLLPEDFALIREYLQRSPQITTQAKLDISRKLAEKIRANIALEKLPDKVNANEFLEAVYLAYGKREKGKG